MCKNVLQVLYHHAKFGGARISLAAVTAKNVEFLLAALRTAQSVGMRKHRYLSYSEGDFEVFRPAGPTHCTNGGEIWHGGVN